MTDSMREMTRLTRWLVRVVAVVFVASCGLACASSYVYDANGRLRAVTTSTGSTSEYDYDALGNLTEIRAVASSQVAVFALIPGHGPVGAVVSITGQGFSSTPSSNLVRFNGTIASVTSSSTTQIAVTVPSGATTGTVSVTVGSNTGTSSDVFVVDSDSGGAPPVVSSFSPAIANPGTSISVTGSQFVASSGTTAAGVNQSLAQVTPISNAQLAFLVSALTGSGPVTVHTPYGQGQSAQSLVVLPLSIPPSSIISSSALTIGGSPQAVNISTAGKSAVAIFNGGNGQWLTLQFSSFSSSPSQSLKVSVYGPSGADLIDSSISTTLLSVDLPPLPAIGTYTIVFTPVSGGTAQFNVAVETNPIVSTSGTTTLTSNVANQTKRATFVEYSGLYYGFYAPTFSATPSSSHILETIFAAREEQISTTPPGSITSFYNLPISNESGTGWVRLSDAGATFSAQLQLVQNPTYAVTLDGSTVNESTAYTTENAYTTFTANQGQNLSLALSNVSTNPAGGMVYFTVSEADNTFYTYSYFYAPGGHLLLKNVPVTGKYTVAAYGPTAPVAFGMNLSTVLTGGLNVNSPFAVNLAKPGQIARLTFSGTAGQYLGLYLQSVASVPSGGKITLTVYKPDGSLLNSTASTASNCFLNLPALPTSGTYTVQVEPDYADTATAQLTLMANPVTTLTIDGGAVNQSTSAAGENTYMNFTGTAGQNVSFALSNVSTTPSGGYVYYTITAPDGTNYTYGSSYATGSHQVLNTLSQSGTYLIAYYPSGGVQTQTMAFSAAINTDATGTLTTGAPLSINLAAGQIGRYTFSGTAGQYLSLDLENIGTTPSGGNVAITTRKPDGTALNYGSASATSRYLLNLPVLPTTGTYTVQVEASYSDASTSQLTVIANPTNVLTIDGLPISQATTAKGANSYMTFSGTAGQYLSLAMTGISVTPSSGYLYFTAYRPDGTVQTYGSIYPSSGHVDLDNLPTTGTYLIVFTPSGGDQNTLMSFNAAIITDASATLTPNSPVALNLNSGQVGYYTFTGTAGTYVGLYLQGLSTTPSGGTVAMTVRKPDHSALNGGTVGTTTDHFLNLIVLPTSGNYSVEIESTATDAASVNLTLVPNPMASLAINGSGVAQSAPDNGETAYATFSGTAGQHVTIALTNAATLPAGGYVFFMVTSPSGAYVTEASIYTSSGQQVIASLPATGTYLITYSPSGGQQTEHMSYTTTVTSP